MGFGSNTNVNSMAQSMAQQVREHSNFTVRLLIAVNQSPEMSAIWTKTNSDCQGNPKAGNWGSNFEMKNIPTWAQEHYVNNVMYVI
jgi:hypothetical protein